MDPFDTGLLGGSPLFFEHTPAGMDCGHIAIAVIQCGAST
jgi:hypothetical protein